MTHSMKIGIDISQSIYKGSGVSRYVTNLTKTILENDRNNQWIFFFSSFRQKIDPTLENKIHERGFKLIKYPFPPTLLSFIWNDFHRINLEKLVGNLDYFITSDWTEPPSKHIKKITVVHDLAFVRYPETIDHNILKTQKKRLEWVKKESQIILTDSYATKDDLIQFYDIEKNKINVVYPGVETNTPSEENLVNVQKKYKLNKPFILTVGKLEPRKNLKRLIDAFQSLNNKSLDLVIVGPNGWGDLSNRAIEQSSNIHFLGYVEDEELFALYSSCLFFVYPSIWEGFGYPIIEAMQMGTAVATSNTSSLKEIAQDGAIFFDPFNIEEITNTLKILIEDQKLRNNLINKGNIIGKEYTWQRAYNEIIEILSIGFPPSRE